MPPLQKIESNQALIGVIGLGYVGLPLLAAFHRAGVPVLGVETDQVDIAALNRGEDYLKHLGGDLVKRMRKEGRFEATGEMKRLAEADVIISCVPTPLGKHLEPD